MREIDVLDTLLLRLTLKSKSMGENHAELSECDWKNREPTWRFVTVAFCTGKSGHPCPMRTPMAVLLTSSPRGVPYSFPASSRRSAFWYRFFAIKKKKYFSVRWHPIDWLLMHSEALLCLAILFLNSFARKSVKRECRKYNTRVIQTVFSADWCHAGTAPIQKALTSIEGM